MITHKQMLAFFTSLGTHLCNLQVQASNFSFHDLTLQLMSFLINVDGCLKKYPGPYCFELYKQNSLPRNFSHLKKDLTFIFLLISEIAKLTQAYYLYKSFAIQILVMYSVFSSFLQINTLFIIFVSENIISIYKIVALLAVSDQSIV